MATWPSGSKASTTNLDSGTDRPSLARADIKQNVDNVNDIIDMFNISGPSNNQILKYNTSNSRFELASDADLNTTYSISAETATGGANLRLTDSGAGTDDVLIASGTGITVSRTDANTITVASTVTDTNTTYSISAVTDGSDANIRLTGSDSSIDEIQLIAGSNITLSVTSAGAISIAAAGSTGMTSFTLAGDSGSSQTISDGNTLTIAGGTNLTSVASATDTITLNLDTTISGLTSVSSETVTLSTTSTSGALNVTYNPATASGSAINLTGKDSQGGTGYFDFLKITNTTSGATNPNKTFRINSTGQFEIVNSAYNSVLLALTDAGSLQANLSGSTVDGTNSVGYRKAPAVGTKTTSYTLATGDVGKYVQVGSGGSIVIPDATFSEGDVVLIANNHSAAITITCSITTAYIAGTDTDKASVSLATRGMASIVFLSSTVCIISGNVS